jgi:hypothetical protein
MLNFKIFIICCSLFFLFCGLGDFSKESVKLNSIEIISLDSSIKYLDIYPTIGDSSVSIWTGLNFHYSDSGHWIFDASNAGLPDTIWQLVTKLNVFQYYSGILNSNYRMASIDFNPDLTRKNQFMEDASKKFKVKIDFELINE